jgi:anthranilate phosphoribosyltransferase
VFAEALRGMGTERALVVCGMKSLDEVSIAGGTWVSLSVGCDRWWTDE